MPDKCSRPMKYAWALALTGTVAAMAVTERGSPANLLLNTLIDAIQLELQGPGPQLPGTGEIPASPGPFDLPPLKEVQPGDPNSFAAGSGDVAP